MTVWNDPQLSSSVKEHIAALNKIYRETAGTSGPTIVLISKKEVLDIEDQDAWTIKH